MEDKMMLMIIAATLVHLGGSTPENINVTEASYEKTRRDIPETTTSTFFEGMTAEQQNNTEVVAQVGGTATIKCYTHFQGDEMVSGMHEARAVIQGGQEVHVHTGVKLKLHCKVELATQPPQYIFWYHNNTMVNFEHSRPLKVVGDEFSSTLIISNLTWEDAGSYTCEAHKAHPANITMHVIGEEKHAALHKDNGVSDDACTFASFSNDVIRTVLLVIWVTYTYGENFKGFLRFWYLR
ncbi:fibronectin type III domain-containing protein-like [Palaemon carinicauda]|uniref:fibronectin type III domain-containing protein-like n=1 Tax=Palaemon carinicauda TaxID=392227 RepID=UPI0035B57207